jgi:hypothetical protein
MVHRRQAALLICILLLAGIASGQIADTLFVKGGTVSITGGKSVTITGGQVMVRADTIRSLSPDTIVVERAGLPELRYFRQTFSFPADSVVVPRDAIVISYSYSTTTKRVTGTWWRRK